MSRCRPRQQAAPGLAAPRLAPERDAERRVLRMASVVRRASGRAGCPSGARPAPTRGYQRRPFCPSRHHQRVAAFAPKQNTCKSRRLAHSGQQGNHTDQPFVFTIFCFTFFLRSKNTGGDARRLLL